ncbi:MAG: tRNA (N(6)-L-threonylcarbamoyladenosine(37)-C(2))-methylthiotransferase MtaB [Oscillospiraceae bacterium]|nr:tRNA (N(6)-L-threonylcarbamoyladenosine(37)-C(2))-methylthiotransferase MtaB [Oscillospiraceae bacterium]
MKIAIYTLGCKVNQYETQAMETILTERGHTLLAPEEQADAYIINTCTVTAVSDKKSRQIIRHLKRQNPAALVAVCGCYAQIKPEEIAALEVDLISGSGDRIAFLNRLEALWETRQREILVDDARRRKTFERLPAGGLEGRTRAMLKVEDGCLNFCTYCIIPYARGPVRSLPLEQAAEDAARLAAEGYQEITITGIEISSWGRDLPGENSLIDLVEAVCHAAPGVRVRLGSLEPRTITPEFCRRAGALDNLCPHFHLSLQSGCDATLRRMNRRYDTARYLESCRLLRESFDRPAIITDVITGFPGETEEEFADTLAFIQQVQFAAMHIFPYSRRTGTRAAEMQPQIHREVKEERARRAIEVAAGMEERYIRQFCGQTMEVLFEEEKDGLWRGHTRNYISVLAPGEALHNQRRLVQLRDVQNGTALGVLVGEPM